MPIDAPDLDDDRKPTGTTHRVERDEGLRETTLEGLANLKAVAREDGVHTAGSSSQISDGAGAVLMMTGEKASALGLTPMARIVDTCLVGVDPVLMLTGPIDATQRLLDRNGMTMSDIDIVEINEAFASVVLAWQRELDIDLEGTSTPTAAPSPSAIPSAAPGPSSSPRRSTSCTAATRTWRSSPCAAAAASAPARSSSACSAPPAAAGTFAAPAAATHDSRRCPACGRVALNPLVQFVLLVLFPILVAAPLVAGLRPGVVRGVIAPRHRRCRPASPARPPSRG